MSIENIVLIVNGKITKLYTVDEALEKLETMRQERELEMEQSPRCVRCSEPMDSIDSTGGFCLSCQEEMSYDGEL